MRKGKGLDRQEIIGLGQALVNVNSKDYKGLQNAIKEHAEKLSPEDKIKYELISLYLQIKNYMATPKPNQLIKAGEFLKKYIDAVGVKNKQFAKYLEIEESNLSAIIKGRRKINLDLALKLGQLFNIDPNFWLQIQSKNELLLIDQKERIKYKKYRLEELLKKVS